MFYSGTVKAQDLYNEIVSKVTAIHDGGAPWWVNQSSLAADGAFASTGSKGTDRIVVILRPGVAGHYITTGYARDYTPGGINTTGAFDVSVVQNMEYYMTASPATTSNVTYHLNITKDRIILHVQGDKLISGWANTVGFIGMPIRYDVNDKFCIGQVYSEDAPTAARIRLIQDSINQTNQEYTWHNTASPGNPSWGNNYFLEILNFGKLGEGLRGELDGIYGMHSDNLVDGNVVNNNGNDYLIIKRVVNGLNGFPRDCLALKMS